MSSLSISPYRQRAHAAQQNRQDQRAVQPARLRQALYRANDLALPLLRSRLAPIDITPIWPQLSAVCHDVALCYCSVQAPLPAVLERLLQPILPSKKMASAMLAALRDASKLYGIGWRKLQGAAAPGSLGQNHAMPHPGIIAADFVHGHVITVIAMLRQLGEGLAQALTARKAMLSAVAQNPRLGTQVGDWLARHQSALLRHDALRVQSAALDSVPAQRTKLPLLQPRDGAGTPGKVERDMEILRFYVAQGNREAYWGYLKANGDPYARLALGVVRNDTISGVIANGYAQMRADQMKVVMSQRDWEKFGVKLMQVDFAIRESYLAQSLALGKLISLPVSDVASCHEKMFSSIGLDIGAWTAHIPLSRYLEVNDQVGAEKVWEAMLDERFFVGATGVLQSEAQALFSSGNAALHADWLGKVSVLMSGYILDPHQAYADADKIGSWRYDNGGWSRMRFDYPAAMDGSFAVERAPARLAEQLHADRLFRLERKIPFPRHPLDATPILPGR
ncbi:hypothetical protein [Janthinobacterium aquaticum]|uniref:hypothetical protein n=1 Tax=Janthinobacterium sp. FT58W TaxID=2654254 RepID=UPI0012658CBF|nr:hypothetical protein [Janthinobacterium sp. FT58W]KAB8042125.1 hypothetical protein GCM43_15925 [Janthinobacterium sp. FT58W]